ncbi:hypothetical protein DCC85_13445 [Paenibacillus sp. CAA11]|uniref:hypothetical protein n=1 Tax=Paenibacillus sp. CAA11 TaxID=1532905 RepID=UPI000D33A5CA|nr:hypothetical protein [Paenibacillus sp. CAA11]AWB45131.1 hypothetical protein DCC85_13445 [Paenibacillus sp. CAA11]
MKSWIRPLFVLLFASLLISACTSKKDALPATGTPTTQDGIMLIIDGGKYTPDVTQRLHVDFSDGITVRDVLASNGAIRLSADGSKIESVSEVSLDADLGWGVRLNGEDIPPESWDKLLSNRDEVMVLVEAHTNDGPDRKNHVVLKINGGLNYPTLKHYYIDMYTDSISVRQLLLNSGIVQLNESRKSVMSVDGYMPRVTERWIVKVNNKKLLDSALDMLLKPSDTVEVLLDRI